MPTFDNTQIKEIAEQLDCGFRAYYHNITGELIFVPNADEFEPDTSAWAAEFQKLEADPSGYYEIERMSSSDVFQVMADYIEQLANPNLKAELLNALNKKKPFREFKQIIDNAGNFRQEWFDFKNESYYHWIAKQLRDSNNETTDNESSQPEIG